jgi:hypothetical protein
VAHTGVVGVDDQITLPVVCPDRSRHERQENGEHHPSATHGDVSREPRGEGPTGTRMPQVRPHRKSLLSGVWIAAHPEHFLQYRRDEAAAAARARKQRRVNRRAESKVRLTAG